LIVNKKARYEYEILRKWEAGIVLKGAEVKSVREGTTAVKLTTTLKGKESCSFIRTRSKV